MGSSAPCDVLATEGIGYNSISEEDDLNNLVVQELGILLCGILHMHDTLKPSCVSNPTLNQDEICIQEEVQSLSLDGNMQKGLWKCATILCSEVIESYPIPFDAREGLLSTTLHNEYFSEAETPTFVHPLSTAPKLASAMKGSRALQGKPLSAKLNVKWAPEVYDPPPTSSSHMVKGYRQVRHNRPKAKKDNYKQQKLIKGKSSRGSVVERKHTRRSSSSRSSIMDPRILKLQALSNNKLPPTTFGQSKVEVALDFAVRSHESKCGSSFYMESLAQVQPPVAEAS